MARSWRKSRLARRILSLRTISSSIPKTLFKLCNNLLRVIKRSGILYMGVPDKRYTFDFDRPVTRYDILKHTYETRLRPDRRKLV